MRDAPVRLVIGALVFWSGGFVHRQPAVPAPSVPVGVVRGRVHIAHPLPPPRRRPSTLPAAAMSASNPDTRKRAVVYLETVPSLSVSAPSAMRERMNQRNETFVPHVLAVTSGSTVDFPNEDPTYHNVFSLSKAKAFDLGRYAGGHSASVRFERPGIVRVFCDIHSEMNAFILVFDHRFFAVTDASGAYRIDRVPPGTWRVTAWYEDVARETRTVRVPAAGGGVELDFALR